MDSRVEITEEDLLQNPNKFGMPTFAEFAKNPDYWRKKFGRTENELNNYSDREDSLTLKKYIKSIKHTIFGYTVNTQEEVERIALDHGVDIKTMKWVPGFRPIGGGLADVLVKWMTKEQYLKRRA